MAALPPGGAHAAGAADPMQVDQPLPAAAAAAAHAPADAKVSGFFFVYLSAPAGVWFRRPGAVAQASRISPLRRPPRVSFTPRRVWWFPRSIRP